MWTINNPLMSYWCICIICIYLEMLCGQHKTPWWYRCNSLQTGINFSDMETWIKDLGSVHSMLGRFSCFCILFFGLYSPLAGVHLIVCVDMPPGRGTFTYKLWVYNCCWLQALCRGFIAKTWSLFIYLFFWG